ncbi:MAG: hypothetical protein RBG13Loki_1606 [Promethearchaeota archaeon CR_4]|nr:MAG: hypothetical protein RBG13Loki_1606 [Candidatus Lokiarchaeota archaeon CR_4]
MVHKKLLLCLVIAGIGIGCLLVVFGPSLFRQYDLPAGANPSLQLPFTDASNLTMIGAYFSEASFTPHTGIDFSFNTSVDILAATGGYVEDVKFWFNEKGGHWQTNVRVRLNSQWAVEVAFESWALTQDVGQLQASAILVQVGMKIAAGTQIGTLLYHGSGCHIDFGINNKSQRVCPYPYFTSEAKATFDPLFAMYNMNPNATVPCN